MLDAVEVRALPQRVSALPPLPEAMTAVMRALNHDHLSAQRCIALIEHDPAIAARILRLANSAFYGVPGRVCSICDAVRLLGLRSVLGVLTAVAMHNAIRVDACPAFQFQVYWRHAVGTALAARALAPLAGCHGDEAFLAGLMHDIGQLVLAAFHPAQAQAALTLAREQDLGADEAERRVIGVAHPAVGALVAAHWHFPPSIVQAVRCHHAPEAPGPGQRVSLAGLVQVADAIVHGLDLAGDTHEAVPAMDPEVWQALGLAGTDTVKLFEGIEQGTRELVELLRAG